MNRRSFFSWFSSMLATAGVARSVSGKDSTRVDASHELIPNAEYSPIRCERVFVNGECIASGTLSVYRAVCLKEIGLGEALSLSIFGCGDDPGCASVRYQRGFLIGFAVYTNARDDARSMTNLHFVIAPEKTPREEWLSRYLLSVDGVAKRFYINPDSLIARMNQVGWIHRDGDKSQWVASDSSIENNILKVRNGVIMVTVKGQSIIRTDLFPPTVYFG